jgi:hypothetical protein
MLYAAVSESQVISWAEVVVEQRPDPVAERVAREYVRRRVGLVSVDAEDDNQPDVGERSDGRFSQVRSAP